MTKLTMKRKGNNIPDEEIRFIAIVGDDYPFCVEVRAVDKNGEHLDRGMLAEFTPDGAKLTTNVDPDLGFPLDDKGRLRVIE